MEGPMDRLESMSVFVAVASLGSFSAASRQLRMPLPTVSRKVSDLESHLKAKLFVRSTRKLTLTEVGHSYLLACKRVLDDVDEAERGASGQYNAPRGELGVTAPIVFGRLHVLPVVTEFLETHPQVDVRMVLSDRALNLMDDHLDLAVRIGSLPDSSLVAAQIGRIRNVVCASPAYLNQHGTPKLPEDLAAHACVTFTGVAETDLWSFGADLRIRVRSRLAVNTAESAIDAAIASVGLTRVLSYQVADAVKAGKLVVVLKKFEAQPLPASLVYVQERRLTAKLRAFLDFATPRLRDRLRERLR
jgi:DNA-binding transcriptional LysR family regulator